MNSKGVIGVCVFAEPAANRGRTVNYPGYLHEILSHIGLFYRNLHADRLVEGLPPLGVLVTIGDGQLSADSQQKLTDWMEAGGVWLAIGSTSGLDGLFGVATQLPTYVGWGGTVRSLGEGFLRPVLEHAITAHIEKPLHFFGGGNVSVTDGTVLATALDAHGRHDDSPALIEKQVRHGRAVLLCVDLTGTVVRIQQGIGVTRDGVAARDGCGPIDDIVLKSGDGTVLDWYFDREAVAGIEGLSAFVRPIADMWRELLIRCILHLADTAGVPVKLLWFWPRNLPAIGHVSHDSDGNDPLHAEILLASLKRARIHSTWCVIPPAYPADIIERIRADGHELAMHYDAMSEGTVWGEEQFDAQWRLLSDRFGGPIITNKNHYLRWEGDVELFQWCATRGIQMDQSKGPSKTGEAGFTFGTCHPFFPVAFSGRSIDVLELPTLTQDLGVFAPPALGPVLLEAAMRAHGVAHFLFHPAHFPREIVPRAMVGIVERGRSSGVEWWTARQINQWERARRAMRWSEDTEPTAATLQCDSDLVGATLLYRGGGASIKLDGRLVETTVVRRWGVDFSSVVCDLRGGSSHVLQVG